MAWSSDELSPRIAAAASAGNLSAANELLQLPEVAANVIAWNEIFRARRLDETIPSRSSPSWRWFATRFSVASCFDTIHPDVLRWFLSAQGVTRVGETVLWAVSSLVSTIVRVDSLDMLLTLLDSPLLARVVDSQERRGIFDQLTDAVVSYNCVSMIKHVVSYGADPNMRTPQQPVLRKCVESGHVEMFDALVALGTRVDGTELVGTMSRSFGRPSAAVVGELVTRGCDANAYFPQRGSLFAHAVNSCDTNEMEVLFERGFADVDGRDQLGRTGLMIMAAKYDQEVRSPDLKEEIAEWLLERGADIHAVNSCRRGVLHWAVMGRSLTVVKLLLKRGADPNRQDDRGKTVMCLVVTDIMPKLTQMAVSLPKALLEAGADPFLCHVDGISLAQWLETSVDGKEFRRANAAFFETDQKPTT